MPGRTKKPISTPQPVETPTPMVAPPKSRLLYLVAGLAALFLFTFFSVEIADSDFWWHLRTGQYIAETHRLPYPDPFAYTTATAGSAYPGEEMLRHFNLTHEWLFQVILFLVYHTGGFASVVLLRILVMSATCATVGLVAYRRTGAFYLGLAAALATGLVATTFRLDRPYLFSFLLQAVVIVILEYRRYLWILPLLFVVWANLHGGFFIGWFVLGAYSVEAAVARFRGRREERDVTLWVVAAVSVAASGLNPNGFDAIRVIMLYQQSKLQHAVWEWKSQGLWPLEPFQVSFLATVPIVLWYWRRVRLSDWLLYAAFAIASFMAVRNVMLFGVVAPFVAASVLPWKRLPPALIQWAMAAALLAAAVFEVIQGGLAFHPSWRYPWEIAKFMEDHHVSGRMINSYSLGGFLIWRLWPLEKVFIDGRALSDNVFDDYTQIVLNIGDRPGRNAADLIAKYGIDVAILDGFEYVSGDPFLSAIAMGDPNQSEWKLVVLDKASALYMKHPPPGVTPIQQPYALASLEQECRNFMEHDPEMPNCSHGLAMAYLHINDVVHGREWLAYYLAHKTGPDPASEALFQSIASRRR